MQAPPPQPSALAMTSPPSAGLQGKRKRTSSAVALLHVGAGLSPPPPSSLAAFSGGVGGMGDDTDDDRGDGEPDTPRHKRSLIMEVRASRVGDEGEDEFWLSRHRGARVGLVTEAGDAKRRCTHLFIDHPLPIPKPLIPSTHTHQ